MHRGHQALIARTREWADKLGVPLAVMCFEPTPREYFTPEQAPPRVTNLRTKLHDFAAAGVDAAIIQRFGPPFCTLGGVEFIEQIRSEEHTSDLQPLMRTPYAVFCSKKKTYKINSLIRISYAIFFCKKKTHTEK